MDILYAGGDAMCLDLQSGVKARLHILPFFLLLWLLFVPIYYVVLWKIAYAATEPEQGGDRELFGVSDQSRRSTGRAGEISYRAVGVGWDRVADFVFDRFCQ
jgi:hypothetical protein